MVASLLRGQARQALPGLVPPTGQPVYLTHQHVDDLADAGECSTLVLLGAYTGMRGR
ncbi:hypothetical protein [Mycobacterium vicinigordonae]|uniref:Uncharacterized protein n=1 Tax=Mycobacterium vicinigordonae TaxID=1719132 RepID=A0A7D6E7J3_9MYCO|nr:hypothetical protein [Mycobacterium vicinigordonae]QLL09002.1 hypothetical protein H0P51_08980 [Mycobacterium vicinigordonae]